MRQIEPIRQSHLGLILFIAYAFIAPSLLAVTYRSGSLSPDASSTFWTNQPATINGYPITIGHFGVDGSVVVEGGDVYSYTTYNESSSYTSIDGPGGTSSLTVRDPGSTWRTFNLFLAEDYSGALTVSNGGLISIEDRLWVERLSDDGIGSEITVSGANSRLEVGELRFMSSDPNVMKVENGGVVEVDSFLSNGTPVELILNSGTINARLFSLSMDQITGSGTINAKGISANGFTTHFNVNGSNVSNTIIPNGGSDSIALNVTADGSAPLSAEVVVENGAQIESTTGRIGYSLGTPRSGLIAGAGSSWTMSSSFSVEGSSSLTIRDGGQVHVNVLGESVWNPTACIFYGDSEILVTGVDSTLTVVGRIQSIAGQLIIENHAQVSCDWFGVYGTASLTDGGVLEVKHDVDVESSGLLEIFVDGVSTVSAGSDGTGDFDNHGLVRLIAPPDLPAGSYTPISVGSVSGAFTGSGTYEAIGGTWSGNVFTVASVINGGSGITGENVSGARYSLDGGQVQVSFDSNAGVADFSVDAVTGVADILGEPFLSGYSVTTDLDNVSVTVSFAVGSNFNPEDFSVWYRPTSIDPWIEFVPESYSYDGQYYSFTTDTFSDYAVTGTSSIPPAPEIAVEQPAGEDLISGSNTVDFGLAVEGEPKSLDFVIKNTGTVELTGVLTSLSGVNDSDFEVTVAPTGSIASSDSSSFTVTFAPSAGGVRIAMLSIASNDEDEDPFTINLTGTGLSLSNDGDNDGLSDGAEYALRDLGFDYEVNQSALVNTLNENANAAGLYEASQVHGLFAPTPVINLEGNKVKLTLDWKVSTDLTNYIDLPVNALDVSVNPDGDIEFEFTPSGNAAFFLLEAQ